MKTKVHPMGNEDGFTHYLILLVLFAVIGMMGVWVFRVSEMNRAALRAQEEDSKEAYALYTEYAQNKSSAEEDGPSQGSDALKPSSQSSPSQIKSGNPEKVIVGNNKPSEKPVLSPNVTPPLSPRATIDTFIKAAKEKDFKTANALMGPGFASDITKLANENDPSKALQTCMTNTICSTALTSFTPPPGAKETTFTDSSTKNPVTQYSFKLSQANKNLSVLIGDKNIDVFLESYKGVWVIQKIYLNGSPLNEAF
jgi:hypothetical protein